MSDPVNRHIAVDSFQIGWLKQTIKHAEETLGRASSLKREQLDTVIAAVIRDLREGRERAQEEAEKSADQIDEIVRRKRAAATS